MKASMRSSLSVTACSRLSTSRMVRSRVRARDTTAAGDVFHGALCVALAEGREEAAAMGWANAAAAIKCANGLGALGAPRRAEVEAMLGDA